jgi:RHS repeat-associated protein
VLEVPQSFFDNHPLYCKYLLCAKNKTSDVYEKQMARISTWTEAVNKGFSNPLSDDPVSGDPFFSTQGLSGYGKKTDMQNRLNAVEVATIPYDLNGDGQPDEAKVYIGALPDVTNPTNPNYYIDETGKPDTNGAHILYLDLMSRRATMSQTEYDTQLDQQRWQMFRAFYLDTKRKLKMSLPDYAACPAALADLRANETLPTRPDSMVTWAVAHGADLPPTDSEVTSVLSSIRTSCNAHFSSSDSTSIANHLKAYFTSNPRNMLRLIFAPEISTNPDLIAIQGILSTYSGCNLNAIAEVDPFKCGKDTTITFQRSGLWKYPGLPLIYSNQPPPQPRMAAKVAAAPMVLSAPCLADHDAERDALEDLYTALHGTQWNTNTGWLSPDISTWYGITLDGDGYVSEIRLPGNNLAGILPASITDFCNLSSLNIKDNSVSGNIPTTIDRLTFLWSLDVSKNDLTGEIPGNIGLTSLNELHLSENHFQGAIPASLGDLGTLEYLYLDSNRFTSMPLNSGTAYESLVDLNISHNHISGYFPVHNPAWAGSFWQGPSLTLEYNRFTFYDLRNIFGCIGAEGRWISSHPQALVDEPSTTILSPGQNSITLEAYVDRNVVKSPPLEYQWFRYVDGENDVVVKEQGPDSHTFVLSPVAPGKYYYTIIDPFGCDFSLRDLTLQSQFREFIAAPDTSLMTFTFCVEYDSTNTTLNKFKFKVDWDDVIAKCLANAAKEDTILAELAVEKLLNSYATTYYNSYRANCLGRVKEHLDYTYDSKEYHYTLYYFDQGANLVQTVPPKGVHPLQGLPLAKFLEGDKTNPMHGLVTRYEYGALNQVLKQSTPDGGESEFHFDDKKRLRLSQNAQQKLDDQFSYTKYDEQGRVVEVGELYTSRTFGELKDSLNVVHFPTAGHSDYVLSDITKTHYDFEREQIASNFSQHFLRTRVAWVEVIDKGAIDTTATYYTYDVHGNVKALLQHIPGLPDKRTDYVYDLISGKVNYVFYQYGKKEQFAHKYVYDADNRVKEVHTSSDRFIWHKEAAYEYYLHGPLARVELGPYRSQGLDYYYTLQGWIKGVNMPFADDPGKDGGGESLAGKDVFSYALGYYENDYKPSNESVPLSGTRDKMNARLQQHMGYAGFYNGNISWMVTDLAKIGEIQGDRTKGMQGMMYRYDQLNRITKSRSLTSYSATDGFAARNSSVGAYDEDYTYDANGNILTLFRRNGAGAQMDDFDYEYYTCTNRLERVRPTTTDTTYTKRVASNRIIYKDVLLKDGAYVPADVPAIIRGTENVIAQPDFGTEDGAEFTAMITDDIPYVYDAIGNLILDQAEGVSISWTPYGKVREVRSHNDSILVKFRYNAVGNRIEKRVEKPDTTRITRYVLDASENVMATYADTTTIEEFVYGGSRLGAYKGSVWKGDETLGNRRYELTNHLGNVLSVITDNIGMNTADTVWATVVKASDYYPFGLDMHGRSWRDTSELTFRYGFNGKEKDDSGEWGSTIYDYGFRIYRPEIARFLSVDPLTQSYPELTPYQYASNSPIMNIDLDGLEGVKSIDQQTKTVTVKVTINYVEKNKTMSKADKARSFSKKEIEKIQKGLKKEFNQKDTPKSVPAVNGQVISPAEITKDDSPDTYNVDYEVTFVKHDTYASAEAASDPNNTDVYNTNQMLVKIHEESVTYPNPNYNANLPESATNSPMIRRAIVGSSSFRRYNLTSASNSHNAGHELFHNLIHNHSNNPLSTSPQYRGTVNSDPGHTAATGIFVRKNDSTGTKIQNINTKNLIDALLTLPTR